MPTVTLTPSTIWLRSAPEATIVGDPDLACSDGSDGTYLQRALDFETGSYDASGAGVRFTDPGLPTTSGIENVAITLRVRMDLTSANPDAGWMLYFRKPSDGTFLTNISASGFPLAPSTTQTVECGLSFGAYFDIQLYGGLDIALAGGADTGDVVRFYDVELEISYDIVDLPVADFSGLLTWRASDDLIQQWDSTSGQLASITSADPDLPEPDGSLRLGSLIQLGDGNILVNTQSPSNTTYDQTGFVVARDLSQAGTFVWDSNRHGDSSTDASGYVSYEWGGGVYDPITGLNWLAKTTDAASTLYSWSGYTNAGAFSAGKGDLETVGSTDAYRFAGADIRPTNAYVTTDRHLYRFSESGDAILRYNLDTDAWQAVILTTDADFLGVDEVSNQLVTAVRSGTHAGWVELYDLADVTWSPTPDLLGTEILGSPSDLLDPTPPGGSHYGLGTVGSGDGGTKIVDGKLYYAYVYPYTGVWGDPAFGWYRIDLTSGELEFIVDIPLHLYTADGTQIPDADADAATDYWTTNSANPPISLVLDLGGIAPTVRTFSPVLRVFPRSDGRGASSAARVWPRPPTAGNGRVGPGSLV